MGCNGLQWAISVASRCQYQRCPPSQRPGRCQSKGERGKEGGKGGKEGGKGRPASPRPRPPSQRPWLTNLAVGWALRCCAAALMLSDTAAPPPPVPPPALRAPLLKDSGSAYWRWAIDRKQVKRRVHARTHAATHARTHARVHPPRDSRHAHKAPNFFSSQPLVFTSFSPYQDSSGDRAALIR
jgi:hypothetical protein